MNNQFNQFQPIPQITTQQQQEREQQRVPQGGQFNNLGNPEQAQQPGVDQHLSQLQDAFKTAANSLTQLYRQSTQSYNVAYQQGKLDAYEEVFAWLLSQQQDKGDGSQKQADYKYVPMAKFQQYVSDNISAQKQMQKDGIVEMPPPSQTVSKQRPDKFAGPTAFEANVWQHSPSNDTNVLPVSRIAPGLTSNQIKLTDAKKRVGIHNNSEQPATGLMMLDNQAQQEDGDAQMKGPGSNSPPNNQTQATQPPAQTFYKIKRTRPQQ